MRARWTTVADLTGTLRKRWDRGVYLSPYARGEEWQPVTLPVRAPTSKELLDNFDRAVKWAQRFRRDSSDATGSPRFTVEHRRIGGRALGTNAVPRHIRIETFEQLCTLLGTADDVTVLDSILQATATELPELRGWVAEHPTAAIEHGPIWTDLLSTVRWIATNSGEGRYLRHLDVPGVDTKFVERHQRLLDRLLSLVLPLERIDHRQTSFAARFGFRVKPNYTRLRLLCPLDVIPSPLTELRLRTEELATLELTVGTVFVVENETSYLAFPEVPEAIAIFGEGFAVTVLERLPWLADKEIVYWGDIDTHGFKILDRLRERFGHVGSILMDHGTLLAHPAQRVREDNPISEPLLHLTPSEQSLYRDLVEDRFGDAVRLEQERIRFSLVRASIQPWLDPTSRRSSALPPSV